MVWLLPLITFLFVPGVARGCFKFVAIILVLAAFGAVIKQVSP